MTVGVGSGSVIGGSLSLLEGDSSTSSGEAIRLLKSYRVIE